MRKEHSKDFSTAQLALLVEKSAQPAVDPLTVITRSDEFEPGKRSICPLCPFSVDTMHISEPNTLVPDARSLVDGSKEMRDHIAAHLESIALLSLPEQEDLDNAASDEVQSESARISSRGEDQDQEALFLTSDAWEEHNLAVRLKLGLDVIEIGVERDILDQEHDIPETAYEDWIHITSTIHPRAPHLDPGQDPVLIPFVERARRIQMMELQKRLGIPLIVVSDPDGLDVSEKQWNTHLEQAIDLNRRLYDN